RHTRFDCDWSSDVCSSDLLNQTPRIDALMIEASFPNSMSKLAEDSRHFTPESMCKELQKLDSNHHGMDILAVHVKPAYRATVIEELNALNIPRLQVMEPGRTYEW